MAVIGVDLDGVICSEEKTFEKPLATVEPGAAEFMKAARLSGHTIVIWTARGWEQYKATLFWLQSNGIDFDQLVMGKPIFDVFIDDRAVSHKSWDVSIEEVRSRGVKL
jgi:hypothetical protein